MVARAPRIALLLVVVLAAACATPGRPPVADRSPVFTARPEYYVVRSGDTLYSIAWRYGMDFMGLARANGLRAPYTIYDDQRIRLRAQGVPNTPAQQNTPNAPDQPAPNWVWPVSAPVLRDYSASNKGVDFRLDAGGRVQAAAAGEVVYAGSGLGGYEHLVIIKHSDHYLSAYSLNTTSQVREGQRVKAGANLADIPVRGRSAATVHFEIRKDGEAVDPGALIGR